MNIKILHQNCDPDLANDRSLPYNTYLVEYNDDEKLLYDIVMTNKKIDIFDYYWDRYREGLLGFKQTEGRINPKLWGAQQPKPKKKK